MNRCSMWNRPVSVLSLCKQPFKSYDLLSKAMQEERRMAIGKCNYKQLYKDPCVSSIKLKQTMKGLLCYSKLIYVILSYTTGIVDLLCVRLH